MATERVAMITAGGSGMGADAARRLAADGFRVAIRGSSPLDFLSREENDSSIRTPAAR